MKRIVCPACGMSTWKGHGCALPGCENYNEAEVCTGCPCQEDGACTCPCYGCKFHCDACWCDDCEPEEYR